jgi:hypothetical protein
MDKRLIGMLAALCALPPAMTLANDVSLGFSDEANPGFEEGDAEWTFTRGWQPCPDEVKVRNVEVRTDGPREGKQYLRIKNDLDGDAFIGLQKKLTWEPDTIYTLSWWTRGHSNQRGFRIRIEGSGSPQDAYDAPYASSTWIRHEYSFHCSSKGNGWIALWVWPTDGYCDIDAFAIRKAFWKADKPSYAPGETATLNFTMAGQGGPRDVVVDYRLLAPDGKALTQGRFQGSTPLTKSIDVPLATPGYYQLRSTANNVWRDTVGFCVLAERDGEPALQALWQP